MTNEYELDRNAAEGQVARDLAQEHAAGDLDVEAQAAGEVTGGKYIDQATPVLNPGPLPQGPPQTR